MERQKHGEKRRDSEYKEKLDGKYKQHTHQRYESSKDILTKHNRAFTDDANDLVQSSIELTRHQRHHHYHRQHRDHRSRDHHHHRHHRRRYEHTQKSDVFDVAEDEKQAVRVTATILTPPALLESPAISVSSSNSSLSTTHYSDSPAVVVDNELPHDHNNQHSSPGKYKIRYSKKSRSTTPISPKRSRSDSLESGADTDSKTESPGSYTARSKRSKSSSRDSDNSTPQSVSSQQSVHSATEEHLEQSPKEAKTQTIAETNDVLESIETANGEAEVETETLPHYYPGVQGCRSVEEFQCLNRIEEGTYGVVYRAKDKKTNELVALKRLKMEKETEGFPITSLREINTLLKGQHPNIVTVREIVVGSNMDQIFIVMDYVEHDMKSLMQTMKQRKQSFLPSEVKCLTQQLLRAVAHLHDNWILHRDLKTSNLLLSHKGILKVADFGLAREYGSPLKRYTPVVVTLWYRAPELLLCSPEYSTPVDMWSVGCIFAEWLQMKPLFTGETEIDQLNRIYKELGTPNEKIWSGYKELPAVKNMLTQNSQFTDYPISSLRKRFISSTSEGGVGLLQGMLTYDPEKRLTAEKALRHEYFTELPLPVDPSMFPTWPAKSELGERKKVASPKPPPGGTQFKQLAGLDGAYTKGAGFQLKF